MDVQDLVREHYGDGDLGDRILNGLREVGVDTDQLTIEDLAALDQLHAGFLPATRYLLEQLELDDQTRLLDVGCGIGGPSGWPPRPTAAPSSGSTCHRTSSGSAGS